MSARPAKGYSLHIALDAFVHHHGHATFTANQDININQLYSENRQRFTEKWGTDFTYFTHPRPEIAELVPGRRNGYLMSAAVRELRGWNFKTDSLANCTE